jgi:hydroxyethylthiazole kinase-like uncharacterized protein yjeF
MTELLTAAQMRAIEQAAIASGEVTGLELMERAGKGVVEAIFEEWPELKATSHRAVVLCGPGNNGGDGFVVARLLKEWGWEVEVFLLGKQARLPPDARACSMRWIEAGGEIRDLFKELRRKKWKPYGADLVVDALFGTGLSRPLPTPGSKAAASGGNRVVSIDVPSGLCADSGRPIVETSDDYVFRSNLTVTFQLPKTGQYLGDGPAYCGKLAVVPIGLSVIDRPLTWYWPDSESSCFLVGLEEISVRKSSPGHKYSHGHALILSGPSGRGGAARLAARGALRVGAGVVTVGCPPEAIPDHAARLDAVMLRGVADGLALEEALADHRINALCVGPGLGVDARGLEVVAVALESRGEPRPTGDIGRGLPRRSVVLDADALTILSQNPNLFAALHEGCVLTPHAGEFARLFPDIAEKLAAPATKGPAYSKVDATREAAARAGCVVLYKGPDTVIADPSGRCAINSAHYDRAAPWLATAGSGDVLAGFITGLLARGFSPFDAACTAAWLHVECALSFGPGLIAEDLPEELPKVFRALDL